jgi:hypothetical protein
MKKFRLINELLPDKIPDFKYLFVFINFIFLNLKTIFS